MSGSVTRPATSTSSSSDVGPRHVSSEFFDSFVRDRIKFAAMQLANQFRMQPDQEEDLRQDMALELVKATRKFSAARSQWHTFACRVLNMFVTRFICDEMERIAKRLPTSPAADPESDLDGHPPEARDNVTVHAVGMDVNLVVARMPARLRKMCELLKHRRPSEVAKILRINRTSVYRFIRDARKHFEKAGFEPHLQNPRDKKPIQADVAGVHTHEDEQ